VVVEAWYWDWSYKCSDIILETSVAKSKKLSLNEVVNQLLELSVNG
jgi:hypothetical protein